MKRAWAYGVVGVLQLAVLMLASGCGSLLDLDGGQDLVSEASPDLLVSPEAVSGAVVKVNTPNGGGLWKSNDIRSLSPERWLAGSAHAITWEAPAATSAVVLRYSTDPRGTVWTQIARVEGNPQTYLWTVPAAVSTYYRVRVEALDAKGKLITTDMSDRAFVVVKALGDGGNAVQRSFFDAVLRALGITSSGFALDALAEWQRCEAAAAWWNPLATTLDMQAKSWPYNRITTENGGIIGVMHYVDQSTGVAATAATLRSSKYQAIRDVLSLSKFDESKVKDALWVWGTRQLGLVANWKALYIAAGGRNVSPTVMTGSVKVLNSTAATLNGTVNPNGLSTTVRFEWGTSTAYGKNTPLQAIGSGVSPLPVSANLTGLSPNATYHCRLVATNSAGTTRGSDVPFAQSGLSCTYALSAYNMTIAYSGGTGSIVVTTTPPGCAWTATADKLWIHITSGGSGSGTGTVNYSVDANGGSGRSGAITIGDKTCTISQSAVDSGTYSISSIELSGNSILAGTGFYTTIHVDTTTPTSYLYGASIRLSGTGQPSIVLSDPQTALFPCRQRFDVPSGTLTGWYDLTVWVLRDLDPTCAFSSGDEEVARRTDSSVLWVYKFVANDSVRVSSTGGSGAPVIDQMGGGGIVIGTEPEGAAGRISDWGLVDRRVSDGEYYWVVFWNDGTSGWVADKYLTKN